MEFSGSILESKRAFEIRMVKWGSVLTIQGQTVTVPLQSPGKLRIFPVLSLFFHLSLPKIWPVHPHKNYIFKINKDRSITSQSLGF